MADMSFLQQLMSQTQPGEATDVNRLQAAAGGDALTGARYAQMKLADNIERQGTRGLTKLFGGDPRSVAEKVDAVLSSVDTSTLAGQQSAIAAIRAIPGAGHVAEQLRAQFVAQNQAQQELNTESFKAQTGRDKLDIDQQVVDVRNREANTESARLALDRTIHNYEVSNAGSSQAAKSELQKDFNMEDWDPRSAAGLQALLADPNATMTQITDFMKTMQFKAPEGYIKREMEVPGLGKVLVDYPVSGDARGDWVTMRDTVNSGNLTAKVGSQRVLDQTERMRQQLVDPDLKTGFWGKVLSYIPTTGEYKFQGDIQTLRSQLGFANLMEAKSKSPQGASGFGALSQKELDLLTDLFTTIEMGFTKDQLYEKLAIIDREFTRVRDTAKTDVTIDDLLGYTVREARTGPVQSTLSLQEQAIREQRRRSEQGN